MLLKKLMKSLQTISPENIEDLSSLLKDCNIVESKNVETSTSVLKDTTDNLQPKSSIPLEDNSGRQVRQELSSHTESSNSNVGELELSVKNVSDNCASGPGLETLDSAAEVSKNVTDVSCMYQVSNSQASSSVGLKPPPFFSWSQTNEALTNQVSYATVQGSQNMVWTSPYQHTQAQYAQLPYYQSQNYSNTYNGTQTYQSQYSVLPQNSVPAKMAHPPPLPPLPPPPPPAPPAPPAPSNSPLPPLPSSEAYPSPSTPSVSVPSDASAHVPLYSKQPLLPSPN